MSDTSQQEILILPCLIPQLYELPESYSKPCQTSKMKRFAKTVDGRKPLTIFSKRSILDVLLGFNYASGPFPSEAQILT